MILVTGGTGFVGAHLLYHLTLENNTITAIYRSKQKFDEVKKIFSYYTEDYIPLFNKIQWVLADITDINSLKTVFSVNFKYVYHCAALVSFNPKDYHKMKLVNIEGTANIINFSITNTVEKVCFVSSIAAVGESINNQLIDEENEWTHSNDKHGYAITKNGAEMEVWRGSQEGVDVIIVNPGVILGSGFYKHASGKLFSQVYNGLKFYTDGSTGFIGVKDVVKSMLFLMNSEVKNQRYILVSENKSFKEIFDQIAITFNKKKPSIKIGRIATSIVWRIDWILTKLIGKEPLLTKSSARAAHNKESYNTAKIDAVLDFDFEKINTVVKEVCTNYKS